MILIGPINKSTQKNNTHTAIAELDARLRAMEVDRDGLGQELQRSQMVLRLLQSSLTGKIRARDELIQQLFDAAAGKEGAAVIEELRARHARLVRQTAGMDVDHGGVAEEAEEAAAAAADLGDHQVILEELAATRSEVRMIFKPIWGHLRRLLGSVHDQRRSIRHTQQQTEPATAGGGGVTSGTTPAPTAATDIIHPPRGGGAAAAAAAIAAIIQGRA